VIFEIQIHICSNTVPVLARLKDLRFLRSYISFTFSAMFFKPRCFFSVSHILYCVTFTLMTASHTFTFMTASHSVYNSPFRVRDLSFYIKKDLASNYKYKIIVAKSIFS
jgi:hypothetical protein